MAIIVTPKSAPASVSENNQPSTSAQEARARAIARMTQSAPQGATTPGSAASTTPAEVLLAQAAITPPEVQDPVTEGQKDPNVEVESVTSEAPDKALSPQYAVLARKEKAFRAQVQQFRAQQAAFKAEQEAFKSSQATAPAFDPSQYIQKDRLKAETLAVLAEEGISYDELTQSILNQPAQDPATKAAIQRLEAQIKAQADAQAKAVKDYEQQQSDAYQQALSQIRFEAKQLIQADPNFETIKETGSVGDVVDLIEQTFKNGLGEDFPKGTLLTVEQAAQMVEEELIEEAMKLAKLKKVRDKMQVPPPSAPKQENAPKPPTQMKTLTNAVSSSRPLTAKERAVLAFEGKLNKS